MRVHTIIGRAPGRHVVPSSWGDGSPAAHQLYGGSALRGRRVCQITRRARAACDSPRRTESVAARECGGWDAHTAGLGAPRPPRQMLWVGHRAATVLLVRRAATVKVVMLIFRTDGGGNRLLAGLLEAKVHGRTGSEGQA